MNWSLSQLTLNCDAGAPREPTSADTASSSAKIINPLLSLCYFLLDLQPEDQIEKNGSSEIPITCSIRPNSTPMILCNLQPARRHYHPTANKVVFEMLVLLECLEQSVSPNHCHVCLPSSSLQSPQGSSPVVRLQKQPQLHYNNS